MPPQPPPALDLLTLAATLATFVFGPAGAVVGAYSIIILSALGGAAWASANHEQSTRWDTLKHFALRVGLALLLTVAIADWMQEHDGLETRWTLGPLAALVAAKPEWVLRRIGAAWNAFTRNRTGGGER
jgi:hypothetical protein